MMLRERPSTVEAILIVLSLVALTTLLVGIWVPLATFIGFSILTIIMTGVITRQIYEALWELA